MTGCASTARKPRSSFTKIPMGRARTSARLRRPNISRWPSASSSRRSEEHTSELQSLMRISYAVFCLKKKIISIQTRDRRNGMHRSTQYSRNKYNCILESKNRLRDKKINKNEDTSNEH